MAEATPYNLDAARADGFVDFYSLLGLQPDADEGEIRDRIQSLYSEAQANRDHRNLNKRRDYQTLLEYLPNARTALLDPAKRALYDDYADQARDGAPPSPFSSFMAGLSGQMEGEDTTDVLGVSDGKGGRTTRVTAAGTGTGTGARTGGAAPVGGSSVSRRQPQVPARTQAGLQASAMSVIVFAVLALIAGVITGNWPLAILIGAVVAVVVWFLARPRGGTPVGR
jgi:DNA-dependent RNA polymerase auxiliary subunit epsilon